MNTADTVKDMLDKPYGLGHEGEAFDCLSFLLHFYESCGFSMPVEWHGWTRENYAARWQQGEGRDELYRFLHSLGTAVGANYMIEQDLMLLNIGTGDCPEITPAIYLGSRHVMIVSLEAGISVVPLWAVREKIFEVRRLS